MRSQSMVDWSSDQGHFWTAVATLDTALVGGIPPLVYQCACGCLMSRIFSALLLDNNCRRNGWVPAIPSSTPDELVEAYASDNEEFYGVNEQEIIGECEF